MAKHKARSLPVDKQRCNDGAAVRRPLVRLDFTQDSHSVIPVAQKKGKRDLWSAGKFPMSIALCEFKPFCELCSCGLEGDGLQL